MGAKRKCHFPSGGSVVEEITVCSESDTQTKTLRMQLTEHGMPMRQLEVNQKRLMPVTQCPGVSASPPQVELAFTRRADGKTDATARLFYLPGVSSSLSLFLNSSASVTIAHLVTS